MRIFGFHGGGSMYELGSVSDMVLFFECINFYAAKKHPETDWSLLTDRLYRRYLRLEELEEAVKLMNKVKEIFSTLPNSAIDWPEDFDLTKTRLDKNLPTLLDIFSAYFRNFFRSVESAQLNYEAFQSYKPVRSGTTDTPYYIDDKNRPLEEYDQLEGKPFWLR